MQVVTWRGTFVATVVTICRVLPSNLFFWQVSLKNQNHRTVIIKIHKFLSLNRACHIHHGVFIVAVFTLGGMVTWYKPKVIFYWCLFVFVILFLFVFFGVDLVRNALSLQIPILPIRLGRIRNLDHVQSDKISSWRDPSLRQKLWYNVLLISTLLVVHNIFSMTKYKRRKSYTSALNTKTRMQHINYTHIFNKSSTLQQNQSSTDRFRNLRAQPSKSSLTFIYRYDLLNSNSVAQSTMKRTW